MKIGSRPDEDLERIRVARAAIGAADLMIDANGAFERKQALLFAHKAAHIGVVWFEEPVSSDDLEGLRLLRDRAAGGLEIAAGEYGYEPFYFKRMMDAGAVDVIQVDATRCCGYTGFLETAALADAHPLPLSATPPRRCTCRCAAPPRGCATLNGSTTMSVSKGCSSMARPSRRTERSGPICRGQAMGSS
jgi:L-alanine-DL-glutamate epimerase-like enolase superfamily enzyme